MTDCPTPPPADHIATADPVRPGVSIGLEDGAAGTLGTFVVDKNGDLCILTARHVLGSGNPLGKAIVQPGKEDGGSRRIAEVTWVNSRADAALARVVVGFDFAVEHMGTGEVVKSFDHPRVSDVLTKSGRSTGVTRARVTAVGQTIGRLKDVFKLEAIDTSTAPISCGGDSGAVWYSEETGAAIGLHHDGDATHGVAFAVPLPYILKAYELQHSVPFEVWNGTFTDEVVDDAALA